MKYLKEVTIIFGITMVGELLNSQLPFPVPAGVYGLFILLVLLCTKVLRVEDVSGVGGFLLDIMPLMFIPAGVGLLNSIEELRVILIPLITISLLSTMFVMVVTGHVAQNIIRSQRRREEGKKIE